MSAVVSGHQEFPSGLPDDLKMPERSAHREAVDIIAFVASRFLDRSVRVFCDLNWYPVDGGAAIAPDLMTLPVEVAEGPLRSYRQGDGPPPFVALEVPSDSDSFASLRAKALRVQALGSPLYIVVVDGPDPGVMRFASDSEAFLPWTGQPIPELGGLSVEFVDGQLEVVLPDGRRSSSRSDLLTEADARAEEADARVQELAQLLRSNGIEPST